jgi:hypothetical protein
MLLFIQLSLLAHVGIILMLCQNVYTGFKEKLFLDVIGSSILIMVLSTTFYLLTKLI